MGRPRARSQSLSSSRLCGTTRCQRTRWTGHVGRKEASFLEERGGHVHEGEQEGLSLKCYMVNIIFLRVLEGMRVCGKGTNITFQTSCKSNDKFTNKIYVLTIWFFIFQLQPGVQDAWAIPVLLVLLAAE